MKLSASKVDPVTFARFHMNFEFCHRRASTLLLLRNTSAIRGGVLSAMRLSLQSSVSFEALGRWGMHGCFQKIDTRLSSHNMQLDRKLESSRGAVGISVHLCRKSVLCAAGLSGRRDAFISLPGN